MGALEPLLLRGAALSSFAVLRSSHPPATPGSPTTTDSVYATLGSRAAANSVLFGDTNGRMPLYVNLVVSSPGAGGRSWMV
jgi:hypothetical protein